MASGDGLTQPVDCGISEIMSSEQKLVTRIADEIRHTIEQGEVKLLALEGDNTISLVYKPSLAALVAKAMTESEKTEYCSGGTDKKSFARDAIVEQIITATGLVGPTLRKVKGTRKSDGKKGEFYEIPLATLTSKPILNDEVSIQNP